MVLGRPGLAVLESRPVSVVGGSTRETKTNTGRYKTGSVPFVLQTMSLHSA